MRSCCVAGCKNTSCCEMLHFFTFPKTKERTEWIKFAEREDWTPSKYSTICSDHFCSQLMALQWVLKVLVPRKKPNNFYCMIDLPTKCVMLQNYLYFNLQPILYCTVKKVEKSVSPTLYGYL